MAYLMKSDSGERVIRDDWYASDFYETAQDIGLDLTEYQIHRAMEIVVDGFDANYGINWVAITSALNQVADEGNVPHATNNTVHMREDLAEAGFTIPAGLSHSNYDELHYVTHLTADDLIGAVEYVTGEDPDSHAFCPVMLRDGRIVYMMSVDLD